MVIDYSTFSSSNCNIFNPVVQVNSKLNGVANTTPHTSTLGQPQYVSTNSDILLTDKHSSTTPLATEFKITYNFKQGYSYQITINAWGTATPPPEPYNYLRVHFTSLGNGQGVKCSGAEPFTDPTGFDPNFYTTISSSTPTDYTFTFSSLSSAYSFLFVGCLKATSSQTLDYPSFIEIKKITITETPPPASFNITPASTAIPCGSSTPVIFTVNNVNNTAGVTAYAWTLGLNNGWLYNGAAAPKIISTGTVNTLTLTPVCGVAQNSVSATVAANGNNYNTTNSGAINITQPLMSISGVTALCSGSSTYSISGIPCNATVAWAATPTGIVSPDNSASVSPTFTVATNGTVSLAANVTACGTTTSLTPLQIHAGPYNSADYALSGNGGSMYWCPNKTISYAVSGGGGGSNYNWSLPTGWSMNYNGGSNYIVVNTPQIPSPPTGTLSVSFIEPCGNLITKNLFLVYSSSTCSTPQSPYSISPNPGSSYINIYCTSLATYCNIAAVQITNVYGNVLCYQSWPYTNQTVQMPIGFLQNGTYIARVYDGTQWFSNTFMVQH